MANFRKFAANEKWKTEVCFPWAASNKRLSIIALSANVSTYDWIP
jgi:hypothetical protein